MQKHWLALGAAMSLVALPALGQMDMSGTTATPSTDSPAATTPMTDNSAPPVTDAPGMIGGSAALTDVTGFRTSLDTLRGYIAKILENDRFMGAAADVVAADPYRRANETLLDNAESVALTGLGQLGTAETTPDDLRLTRVQLLQVWDALHRARMMTDYDLVIRQASGALDHTYQAFDSRSSSAMSGQHMDLEASMREANAAMEAARRRQLEEEQTRQTRTTTTVAYVPPPLPPRPEVTPAPEYTPPPAPVIRTTRRVETTTVRHTTVRTTPVRRVRRAAARYKWVWVCHPVKVSHTSHVRRASTARHMTMKRPRTTMRRMTASRKMKPGYRCHWVRVRVRVR